jgi:hypothetical protein
MSSLGAHKDTKICHLDISHSILYNRGMSENIKIHYVDVAGWAACGAALYVGYPSHEKQLTYVPRKVTCGRCKATKEYQEMMDAGPNTNSKTAR